MKFREIGARIAAEAPKYPCEVDYSSKARPTAVAYQEGAFKVACLAYREAVLNVAAKYSKGFRKAYSENTLLKKPTLCRPPDADVRLKVLLEECGEITEELPHAQPLR